MEPRADRPGIPSRRPFHRWLQRWTLAALLLCALLCPAAQALRADDNAFFGKETTSQAALMGILYDLKQTQRHAPTGVDVNSYGTVLDEFLSKGFDESILNQYYRTSKPLYTTQIYIPVMSASQAPKAFNVEKIVKPSRWVIHYKAQVLPPEDGTYRFVGYADDVIFVAVNGKIVLNGSRLTFTRLLKKTTWQPSEQIANYPSGNSHLTAGDWIPLTANQPIDLDILIGEHPGGQFCAFLLYEKQGASYPVSTGAKPHPILPLFQVAPYDGTLPKPGGTEASINQDLWKCLQ